MEIYEEGTKRSCGPFSLLDLRGTWTEMGRQYGKLAQAELQALYQAVKENMSLNGSCAADDIRRSSRVLFMHCPCRFKEMIRGMSQTSGLDLEAHMILNALEFLRSDPMEHLHCVNIAAWGEYAADPLVFGRHYDYYPWLNKIGGSLIVTVMHPSDGSAAVATLTWAGAVSATTGMNRHGIFLGMNSGVPSGGALCYDSRVPTSALLLACLLDIETLDDLESFLQTSKSNFACIVATADGQASRCYEWPVFEVKRRRSVRRPGLMVATNHFTEFSWGLPRPQDEQYWNTRSKRQNLLNLAEHFKGSIDAKCMRKLLETHFNDLGAMTSETVWQLVVIPQTLECWLRVPDFSDWVFLPLKEYLRPEGS